MARRKGRKPIKYYSPKRRAVYERGDKIDHLILFELYAWTCCLCQKPINRHLRNPHFMAATIEHVVPISKGGTHTWDNVKPAHAKCNFEKANSLLDDFSGTITA